MNSVKHTIKEITESGRDWCSKFEKNINLRLYSTFVDINNVSPEKNSIVFAIG
jgi:hypothetical protein